ncbi:MAG: right-handed parallel beta-helix repeat-containing protein [Deltaproteobacteria bacterium]|nr:right-handed parallel beta-helix repeat-containing protein [Deltaproteobacteria bacterium]
MTRRTLCLPGLLGFIFLAAALASACDDSGSSETADVVADTSPDTADTSSPGFPKNSCATEPSPCMQIAGGDAAALQQATNSLDANTTLVLGTGTFALDNQVTIRQADGVRLIGQGIDVTTLSFAGQTVQSNGVDVVGDDFLIQDLTIADSRKDALRVEESVGVTIRRVKATWTGGVSSENGAYGLYPVRCQQVLMEDSEAWFASDAGIYVGQSRHVVVRNNVSRKNVAGLEIENTQFADVYGNTVEDNTAGLVVFDLPGNPVVGRDVKIHDNSIRNNNEPNFAPGGTVSQVPAGTGTFALASRRVEIADNTYENNQTVDIAILSGLVIESDIAKWTLQRADIVGDLTGLMLDESTDTVANYRTSEILVHGNTHSGSGTAPDADDLAKRELGVLLKLLYGDTPVDTILYDAIGEASFSATVAADNSNTNHVCVTDEGAATFASLDIENLQSAPLLTNTYRPDAPFAPFDCTALTGSPVMAPTVPQAEAR